MSMSSSLQSMYVWCGNLAFHVAWHFGQMGCHLASSAGAVWWMIFATSSVCQLGYIDVSNRQCNFLKGFIDPASAEQVEHHQQEDTNKKYASSMQHAEPT